MNKKAAEMTIGTIIIIILALVVLVVIIYGFTTGWGNLWQRLTGFSPKANVQVHVQSCQLACSSEAKSDYCKNREVLFNDKDKTPVTLKCPQLVQYNVGLEACPAISDCEGSGIKPGKSCDSWNNGLWEPECTGGRFEVNKDFIITSEKTDSDNTNKKCCTMKKNCELYSSFSWASGDCQATQYDVTSLITKDTAHQDAKWHCCVN